MKIKRFLAVILVMLLAVTPLSVSAVGHLEVKADIYANPNGNRTSDNLVAQGKFDDKLFGSGKFNVYAKDYQHFVRDGNTTYERLGLGLNLGRDGKPVKAGLLDMITLDGSKLTETNFLNIIYGTHSHVFDPSKPWYDDFNFHWKYCEECGARVNFYHQDVDDDGVCDICAKPIHYRYVTVKDVPGGKIEVSKEKCMLGNRVAVTAIPDEGYRLQEVHGVSNNGKNSPWPCFATRTPNQYFMYVDVCDIEIQSTFVEK